MHKLVLLFTTPPDLQGFENRWSGEFVPAVERMPGIQKISVGRVAETLHAGADVYLQHEIYFQGTEELHAALTSAAGQRAGELLMEFAGDFVTICLAEHQEEERDEAQG